ncbi:ABC-F family ATP-binding cassette domain-containing protein [Pseudobacteriovorax antillogorgiicola]|uniref:ATP-binding cassette, subfamily F, uup n=1 Tax=Pseudobacteriovorax antillogorgiicola TaxID=1513793 RepID=A0A1Y6BAH2_9BACT|nr:ABC-F family ATP-binding cassette domain-containing protein [Pseudobacteriovorax antillogorgiicola]TCS58898.1 ATP-binding cassette subfamily F protein uup [Pseudobacteriovorax antillogorgiicola]SME93416.1 ATP-binding cassette, subfamily F, uup [Pseudobacteriovorax antillogorgiicola]
MSLLLNCHEIGKSFASKHLFEGLTLGIEEGARLGIIGINGVGKSTLLKILGGSVQPDEGTVSRRKLLKTAYVEQDSRFDPQDTLEQVMMVQGKSLGLSETDLMVQAPMLLSKAGFERYDVKTGELSGGWRKRLAIAQAMLGEPDLIFLDEPTNHLDFEAVLWLEGILTQASFAWVMVSHDRFFLDRTVNTIAEVNKAFPGGIFLQKANYSSFQDLKADYLEGLSRQEEALSNKVRREVEWLRRGPKARTTKAKYRIDDAKRLISDLADLRQKLKSSESQISFGGTGRKTKRLVVIDGIEKSYDGRTIFRDVNLLLSPGMVLGVLGPNGCGKSTLLKALQKEISVDSGEVTHAPDLKIVYFDQNRRLLDPNETLKTALSEVGGDSVIYQDQSVHIVTWAKRFQFTNEQLTQKVGALSGGEQARVMISRLMQQKADVLILDEPTNDLDIQTLELLEQNLADFPGCIVIVSHDRYLMKRLTDLCIGFLGDGKTGLFADYEQWERELQGLKKPLKKSATKDKSKPKAPLKKKVKLSYMEQREYDQMEGLILDAEQNLEAATARVEDPELASNAHEMQKAYESLQTAQAEVDRLYARWTELEEKQQEA